MTVVGERGTYDITGALWDGAVGDELPEERLVVNMGPQHPSSHGVCRMVLEMEGETVTEVRPVVGYLHTGIEKNAEYRTWTQGTTFVTRADYLSPVANETVFCLGVEKLLGVAVPGRAEVIRVLMLELNRIASHLILLATSGMELGATTMMIVGLREREMILDIFEVVTGLRMNMAYVRPGGVAQDVPDEAVGMMRDFVKVFPERLRQYEKLMNGNTIFQRRVKGIGYLDVRGCLALGVTGPVLRSAGLAWDLRKTMPYLGYETYDFEVPVETGGDVWARWVLRIAECRESLRIIEQALDRLEPGPVMVEDKKIAWPAQLAVGTDGMGNSLAHVRKIMGQSMEALIHHFKLVTEGFRVPAGQVYTTVESPRGEIGCHLVSDGGTRPYRVHLREPSFINLQALPAVSEGGLLADVVVGGASLDPVMGGCDR